MKNNKTTQKMQKIERQILENLIRTERYFSSEKNQAAITAPKKVMNPEGDNEKIIIIRPRPIIKAFFNPE
jgi:hypothetical protein